MTAFSLKSSHMDLYLAACERETALLGLMEDYRRLAVKAGVPERETEEFLRDARNLIDQPDPVETPDLSDDLVIHATGTKFHVGKVSWCVKGGHARAAALSPERRSEIARKAAEARWGAP